MPSRSKSVSLTAVPPVPYLQLALIGLVDSRIDEVRRRLSGGGKLITTDKLRRLAKIALTLSQQTCFFCAAKTDASIRKALKAKSVPWEALKLCSCLAEQRMGYREYYPWRDEVKAIPEMVESGRLNPKFLMYSDRCSRPGCGKPFQVTAQMIANSVKKHGNHQQMRRCKACVEAARQRAEEKQLSGSSESATNAARPPKKRQEKPSEQDTKHIPTGGRQSKSREHKERS